ncbi:MAG: putative peptidoglycan glycosyltransferase FtsW, partial [Bryobacteraceae bacterium]
MARERTDWILFLAIITMVAFGLVVVYSASSVVAEVKYHETSHFFLVRQVAAAIVALAVMMFLKKIDYRDLNTSGWAFASLGVVLMMLVAVYVADPKVHRWFHFGPMQLQPSEFAKPALAIFLAYFITARSKSINHRGTLLPAALSVVVLALTVVVADFGTAVVLIATAGAVLYVAGMERRYFAVAIAVTLMLAGVAVASKPYRLKRVIDYFDPEYKLLTLMDKQGKIKAYANSTLSPRDSGYQGLQSRIAIGTGGALGVGLMQGKQKMLYLPEAHTDFIYAVVGEELGFLGCSALLAGFLTIMWRGLRLFQNAPDSFGRYLALGVTTSVVVQALINMSVVLDMGPTKGIPLPMISYGGSSVLSTLISLGLLLSVSERAT